MILKLVFKSIKNSIIEFKRVYLLMLISQFIAVLCIFFAYGIYGSYSAKMQELDTDDYMFWAEFSDSDVGSIRQILPEILDELEERMDFVLVSGTCDIGMVKMHSEYHNGRFYSSKSIADNVEADAGRFLTDADILDSNNVIFYHGIIDVGETVEIKGTEFEVIGARNNDALDHWSIPFTSCPDEVKLLLLAIRFEELPTYADYTVFKDTLESNYGDKVSIDEFEFKDNEEIVSIKTVIAISICIGVISALNICLLYGYIISRRRKQMAVYGIVGAAKGLRLAINEIEIMLVSCIVEILGFLLFRFVLQKIFTVVYENSSLYNTKAYLVMLSVYIICIFIITYIMLKITNNAKLADMMRRAQND